MKVLHTIAGKYCPHTGWTSEPSGESGRKSCMHFLTIHNFFFTYRLFGPFISFPVFLYRNNFISCWVFGPFSSSLSLHSLHVSHHQDHHTHVCKFWCEGILSSVIPKIFIEHLVDCHTLFLAPGIFWRRSSKFLLFFYPNSCRCSQLSCFLFHILAQFMNIPLPWVPSPLDFSSRS